MQDSVYYKAPKSLYRDYIKVIVNKTKTAPEIFSTFRERSKIPKEFTTVTASHLANNPDDCMRLIHILRAKMEPESPKFPFANYKKIRGQELIDDLAATYHIVTEDAKAAIEIGSWPPNPNRNTDEERYHAQIFNYRLEVVIAPFVDTDRSSLIIGYVNSIPGLDHGESYFEGGSYYVKTKDAVYPNTRSIRGILSCCGFYNIGGGWKKRPCLVYIDLITPCPNWQGSAGKTHIDLTPYQDLIGSVVSRLASKMPSVRLKPTIDRYERRKAEEREGLYMDKYLKPFLKDRREAIEADNSLRIKDHINQSAVWYRKEDDMRRDGFVPQAKDEHGNPSWQKTRRSFQNRISEAIEELWPNQGITREYLGISAKARAMIFFGGKIYPVTSDSIKELSELRTTHLIIIEKEGVAEPFVPLAAPFSIALAATAGQPVKYALELAKAAHKNGIRVCTLYDDDLTGRESADRFKELGFDVPRLGVDKHTIEWLQQNGHTKLNMEKFIVNYTPQFRKVWKYDAYLKTQKIETDVIIAKINPGGAEAVWKFILHKLTEVFPDKINYIDIVDEPNPEDHYPKELQDLQNYLKDLCELSYSNKWNKIQKDDLKAVDPTKDGLMNIDYKNKEIFAELDKIVKKDPNVKDVSKSIKELLDSLPSITDLKKKYDAMKEVR